MKIKLRNGIIETDDKSVNELIEICDNLQIRSNDIKDALAEAKTNLQRFFLGGNYVKQHDEEITFHNVIIAVSCTGLAVLVSSPCKEVEGFMDGCLFTDNCKWYTMLSFPKEPGVYSMTIKYHFDQGYYEGYPNDGESTWDFIPSDIKRLVLAEQSKCR